MMTRSTEWIKSSLCDAASLFFNRKSWNGTKGAFPLISSYFPGRSQLHGIEKSNSQQNKD